MGLNQVIVEGNLTADPVVRQGQGGKPYTTFTVAINDKRGEETFTTFVDCTAFGYLGEHIAKSMSKGQAVIAYGKLTTYVSEFETTEGTKKVTKTSINVWEAGPSLQFATATVTKSASQGNGGGAPVSAVSQPSPASSTPLVGDADF